VRILIAVHGFPPTHSAGAERQAERMAHWLIQNGHSVAVFAVEKLDEPGFRVETSEHKGLTIHRLFYDVKDSPNPFQNLYDNPQIGAALDQVLADESFDLVHLISGYLLGGQIIHTAQKHGIPVVVSLMEYWFLCAQLNLIQPTGQLCSGPETDQKCARCLSEEKRRYRLPAELAPKLMNVFWNIAHTLSLIQDTTHAVAERRVTLQNALQAADLVICNSRYLIDKFAEFNFDTRRFVYIRQGLTTATAHKPTQQMQASARLRLGYTGQIKPHKGVDILIEAVINLLKQDKPISLDLWGVEHQAAAYVAHLKQATAPYPTIRWNGSYTGTKVWEVLGNLDALVIPSRWYENSPNVILEAYEIGLPVIATRLGGMAELVEDGKSGLLFELNNVQAQITRLLDTDTLNRLRTGIPPVKTLDAEMREVVEHYTALLQRAKPITP
jgi:glycosyltransferase involved in cell wall biosynthesis